MLTLYPPPPSTVRGAKTNKSMLCISFTLYFLWGSKMSWEAKIGFPEVTLSPTSPCHCSTSQLQLQPDCTREALGAPRTQTVSRGPGCHKSSGMPLPPVAAPAFKHSHCLPAVLCCARLEGHSYMRATKELHTTLGMTARSCMLINNCPKSSSQS